MVSSYLERVRIFAKQYVGGYKCFLHCNMWVTVALDLTHLDSYNIQLQISQKRLIQKGKIRI